MSLKRQGGRDGEGGGWEGGEEGGGGDEGREGGGWGEDEGGEGGGLKSCNLLLHLQHRLHTCRTNTFTAFEDDHDDDENYDYDDDENYDHNDDDFNDNDEN